MEKVNLWMRGIPTNSTKTESPRNLMIPQYATSRKVCVWAMVPRWPRRPVGLFFSLKWFIHILNNIVCNNVSLLLGINWWTVIPYRMTLISLFGKQSHRTSVSSYIWILQKNNTFIQTYITLLKFVITLSF